MQLFQQAITQSEPKSFNSEASKQIWELSLSSDLSTILKTIEVQDSSHVFCIYGEPGSGCTTLVQGVCQCLSDIVKESEILFMSLDNGSNELLLWEFMSKLAKERNDQEKASLFTQPIGKDDEKRKALSEFLQYYFKVICIDNAGHWIDSFIKNVLKECNITSFIVYNQEKGQVNNEMVFDFISNISVHGLKESVAKTLVTNQLLQSNLPALTDEEKCNLCEFVKCNPFAIKLFCGVLSSADRDDSKDLLAILQKSNYTEYYREQTVKQCTLDRVLELIFGKVIKESSVGILYKLCSLRQPLPLMKTTTELEELLHFNLLNVKQECNVKCVDLHPSLRKHLINKKVASENTSLDILRCWLSLVSNTLTSVIIEAEENAWPFVPEKWQFIQDVGQEENYNVKELITCKNANIPSLTELQILQECLYHAFMQKDFSKLAALVLVLDRFLYWQGSTKTTMDVLDFIQTNSPETAIAPQLVIRRARFMKNEGNLREAEATLDTLLHAKEKIGQWKYRKNDDFWIVSGVCVQIKGEIQYRLGHWYLASNLLTQSIRYFSSLNKPDKKGLSSSYGLLCLCLRNMTVQEYRSLAQQLDLIQYHPLLAAYFSAKQASMLSVYTPMFFLRHSCQAGEVMLEFVRLTTTVTFQERELLLRVAIEDLIDSIQAHQTYKSLTSREQFYLFVCAVYKLSFAFLNFQRDEEQARGRSLKKLSLELYEHYCSSMNQVLIDDKVITLIDQCLVLLGLEKFQKEDLANAGQVLLEYFTRRQAERLEKNSRLVDIGVFVSHLKPILLNENNSLELQQQNYNYCAVNKDVENVISGSKVLTTGVVDQCADTVDPKESEDAVVNQCADTVDSEESEKAVVDQCVDIVDPEKSEEAAPQNTLDKGVVDRWADTVESEESEENVSQNTQDTHTGLVDRNADTLELIPCDATVHHQRFKTVDECAMFVGRTAENELPTGVIVQRLQDEAISLSSKSYQIPMPLHTENPDIKAPNEKVKKARDAILWKYDFPSSQWRRQPTIVFIRDLIKLDDEKKGAQRDVFAVEFINQDEPLGRYVAKRYRKERRQQQYENDLLSQMTARHYVTMFNQSLSQFSAGATVGEIQFLPVVLLQLVDSIGHVTEVFNVEPYMSGEFTKLTDNVDWKNENKRTDLVLAYSHFTYQASGGKLMIVDIQGWVPHDNKGCTFLTDPQIHSTAYKCFGTGNFKEKGYENFWRMHSECNEICKMLSLVRPQSK